MKMPINPVKFMPRMGKLYERLYPLPAVGDPLVRGINRGIARMNFHNPILGLKRHDSVEGFKKQFLELVEMMQLPIEIIPDSEGPEGFEIYVNGCPYGYHRADQQGVCDAAMDMDRILFKLMGADLTIRESAVQGAPRCRVAFRMAGRERT